MESVGNATRDVPFRLFKGIGNRWNRVLVGEQGTRGNFKLRQYIALFNSLDLGTKIGWCLGGRFNVLCGGCMIFCVIVFSGILPALRLDSEMC